MQAQAHAQVQYKAAASPCPTSMQSPVPDASKRAAARRNNASRGTALPSSLMPNNSSKAPNAPHTAAGERAPCVATSCHQDGNGGRKRSRPDVGTPAALRTTPAGGNGGGRAAKRPKLAELAVLASQESEDGGGCDADVDNQQIMLMRMMTTMMQVPDAFPERHALRVTTPSFVPMQLV